MTLFRCYPHSIALPSNFKVVREEIMNSRTRERKGQTNLKIYATAFLYPWSMRCLSSEVSNLAFHNLIKLNYDQRPWIDEISITTIHRKPKNWSKNCQNILLQLTTLVSLT